MLHQDRMRTAHHGADLNQKMRLQLPAGMPLPPPWRNGWKCPNPSPWPYGSPAIMAFGLAQPTLSSNR
ncbi:uncharacterized protein VTP21DRAFT_2856 [Calcarisporiella thermophila]|uniref:uncharacterized protein n=1 Tax=Calcarisporiella thermophila TaxID=911321 RepID=UPI0037434BB6